MTRWFRFYDDAINDPKILRLGEATRWRWVALLCAASKNDGHLPGDEELAIQLRLTAGQVQKLLEELLAKGLLDKSDAGYAPHNWNGRQYKSDVSTERVKRFRERRGNVSDAVSETVSERPQITDTESEGDNLQNKNLLNRTRAHTREAEEALEAWNGMAERCGLPKAEKLTDQRRKALRLRLEDCGGLDGWRQALAKVEASPFLRGDSANGWRANLDFLLQPSSFTKLREGAYDRRPGSAPPTSPLPAKPRLVGEERLAAVFDAMRRRVQRRDPSADYDLADVQEAVRRGIITPDEARDVFYVTAEFLPAMPPRVAVAGGKGALL